MKVLQVSAKASGEEGAPTAVVSVNTGDNAEESIKMFGSENVNSNANANWTVTIQAGMRRLLKAGKSQEEIQAAYADAKMGVALARVSDPTSAILAKWPSMTEADRTDFLKKLKGSEAKK